MVVFGYEIISEMMLHLCNVKIRQIKSPVIDEGMTNARPPGFPLKKMLY